MSNLNVCHMISGDLWAGAECQAVNLLSELVKNRDLRLSAITFNPGRLSDELKDLGIAVTCLPEDTLSSLKLLRGIQEHLRHFRVDIIHCHGHKEHMLGCTASLLSKKPPKAVRTLHGMPEPFSGIARVRSNFFSTVQALYLRYFTDKIIVVSRDMKRRLSNKNWAEKIICIHNGIDVSRVKTTVPRVEMRHRLGIQKNDFVIGTACRLVPIKRLDLLLEAFRIVNQDHPQTLLVISGDGPLYSKLTEQVERLEISSRIKFLGHRNDIYDVMSTFDVFVMTSEHEGIPMALLEAEAMKIPIIATDVGGISEICSPLETTQLVVRGHVDAVVRAVLKAINTGNDSTNIRKSSESYERPIEKGMQLPGNLATGAKLTSSVYHECMTMHNKTPFKKFLSMCLFGVAIK